MAEVRTDFTGDSSSVEAAATRAQKSINGVAAASSSASVSASKAAKALGPLGGVLGKISPEAGSAASSIAGLTGGIEGLQAAGIAVGPALAAVAAVAGVLATAYQGLTAESEHQAEIQRIITEGSKGLAAEMTKTSRVLLEAQAIERGLTDTQREHILGMYDASVAYDKATESSRKLIEANNELLSFSGIPSSWSEATGVLSRAMGDLAEDIDSVDGGLDSLAEKSGVNQGVFAFLTTAIRGGTTSTTELREESAAAVGTMIQQKAALILATAAAEKKAKADAAVARRAAAAAAATRDAAAATREAAAANRDKVAADKKAEADAKDLVDSAQALIDKTNEAGWTERERIEKTGAATDADFAKRLEQFDKESQTYRDLQDARVEAARQTQQALSDLDTAEIESAEKKADEQKKSAREAADAAIDAAIEARRESAPQWAKTAQDWIKVNEEIIQTFDQIGSQIDSIAAEIGGRFEEALTDTRTQISEIDGLLEGLGDTTKDASQISGEELVAAYKMGEVAAEDLSETQKQSIEETLEAEKAALKKKEKAEKDAALVAFRIGQGVAIAQAIISTAQGVIAAFQLGPIAGAIAAGAIGAIGATQVALIASEKPKFHEGGFLDGGTAPDEVNITARRGEAVLSGQGRRALGDDVISAANAGRLGGGSRMATTVYKHKSFNYFVSDNLLLDSPLSRTTRRGDRVGQVRRGRAA